MLTKTFRSKRLLILSLITCLCLSGCGNADTSESSETIEETASVATTVSAESSEVTQTQSATSESAVIEESIIEESTTAETSTVESELATTIAYAAGLDDAVWSEGTLDIRFPELAAATASWDKTLPIPLWGEVDVIASIPAPLTDENVISAGYTLFKEDGSTTASISDGSANSYSIGFTKGDSMDLEYVVVSLDAATLFGTDAPTLQHVLNVLGTPSLGFAYDTLEARYYYLYQDYYLEVSMTKADDAQSAWTVSKVLYYDASAYLNLDFNQELSSVLKSGLNGFTSEYIVPESYQDLTKNPPLFIISR